MIKYLRFIQNIVISFIPAILVLISVILILEMLSFIGIFWGILLTMGCLFIKGIAVNGIIYIFFLFSFLLFFLFLSFKKGKKLLLVLGILFFSGGLIAKYLLIINNAYFQPKTTLVGSLCNSIMSGDLVTAMSKNNQEQKPSFEEDFDNDLDQNWVVQLNSFQENGCEMSDSQIKQKNSILTLCVDVNKKNNMKPYKGAEIGSKSAFLYGTFTVRMKNQIAAGTVSSFFLINKWKAENWEHKEIDIEFLGKNNSAVQFTVHHFKEGGKKHIYKEYTHFLGFNSADNYHDYTIIWNKDSIGWLVDGKWVHSEKNILIDEEMYIRINHWAADISPINTQIMNWLGPIDIQKLPSESYYDYIKYYSSN